MTAKRSTVVAALAAACAAAPVARAAGLSLAPVPGPGGVAPFVSPGGFGPTFVTAIQGDTHRFFVGTKDGYIFVVKDGVTLATPFLDIHSQVSTYNEDGMFSLVFDPDYAHNRRFYVDYSDTANLTLPNLDNYHLDAFTTSASNPDVADPSSQRRILMVPTTGCVDMSSPHYGGQLAFGPDHHLWVSIGDGGDGSPTLMPPDCDKSSPLLAPDLSSLHGKILRIDPQPAAAPDADGNRYTVPSDNPLVGDGGGVRPEIWASGLRNPWRFSFDSATGDLIIGDVGNAQQEEIDRVPSTLPARAEPPFFGWPCTEGVLPWFPASVCLSSPTPVAPRLTFTHTGIPPDDSDCTAIIGGMVLHDPSLAGDYDGRYVYGYFCGGSAESLAGRVLTTDLNDPSPSPRDEGIGVGLGLSSFGADACGHPYATNVLDGGVWRITGPTDQCGPPPEAPSPPDTTVTPPPSTATMPAPPYNPPVAMKPPKLTPPQIHVSLRNIKTLRLDHHHKLHVSVAAITRDARGTLSLSGSSGKNRLAPAVRFRVKAGKRFTVELAPSSAARRSIARHHGLGARLALSLTPSDGKTATAKTNVRVLPAR